MNIMNYEDILETIYEDAMTEHEAWLESIRQLPPADIIDRAYEIAIRQELLSLIEEGEEDELPVDSIMAMPENSRLKALYAAWMDCDYGIRGGLRNMLDDLRK